MKENHFIFALQDAKQAVEKSLELVSELKTVKEYRQLDESDLYMFDEVIIRTMSFLFRGNDDLIELFIYSMNNLPDDLHFGFYNIFSEPFSQKNFEALIEKTNEFLSERKTFCEQLEDKKLYDLQGVRAVVMIKTLEAFLLVGNKDFEKALSLFLELTDICVIEEIDYSGIIGLLYLVLEKYDEIEELNESCEYENAYLDYVFAFYLFKQSENEEDVLDATSALRDAFLENPIVIELFRSLDAEDFPEEEFNLNSLYEAELIITGLALLIEDSETAEWFTGCAASVLAEITTDPELQELVKEHYENEDECDDECCDCGDDHCADHDHSSDEDSKIIKLYDK
jgi:hypothetical protein